MAADKRRERWKAGRRGRGEVRARSALRVLHQVVENAQRQCCEIVAGELRGLDT